MYAEYYQGDSNRMTLNYYRGQNKWEYFAFFTTKFTTKIIRNHKEFGSVSMPL